MVSNGQDRWNLLGLHLEQVPKVNLESQGKKPAKKHKNPKQYTPFCLGYRTGVLESGLSADVELRERKGSWLVRNWSLVAGSRVLAMALYDAIDNRVMELAMKAMTRGKAISQTVHTLDTFWWRNTKWQQRSAQSSWWSNATCRIRIPSSRTTWLWLRADSNVGSWDVVVLSTEYEIRGATCSIWRCLVSQRMGRRKEMNIKKNQKKLKIKPICAMRSDNRAVAPLWCQLVFRDICQAGSLGKVWWSTSMDRMGFLVMPTEIALLSPRQVILFQRVAKEMVFDWTQGREHPRALWRGTWKASWCLFSAGHTPTTDYLGWGRRFSPALEAKSNCWSSEVDSELFLLILK